MIKEKNWQKYRHISFDLWLTLIKSNPDFKPKRNQLFKDYFAINKPIEEVAAVIRHYDVLTNTINEKVCRNFHTNEIYYLILSALGADINVIDASMLNAFYTETEKLLLQYKPVLLHDNILALLQHFQAEGKTVNILSNTAFIKGSSLRKVLDYHEIGQYFAFQAYSDETGYSKPATEMYQYAYDNIRNLGNILKNEVLHIGDNVISDYDGAIKFGFDAHLLTNQCYDELKLQPA
nr:HAD family hydrolase [uncultured Flavobacterium sp.]